MQQYDFIELFRKEKHGELKEKTLTCPSIECNGATFSWRISAINHLRKRHPDVLKMTNDVEVDVSQFSKNYIVKEFFKSLK